VPVSRSRRRSGRLECTDRARRLGRPASSRSWRPAMVRALAAVRPP